jgi:predicted alpha/beta superfamily hydrolase
MLAASVVLLTGCQGSVAKDDESSAHGAAQTAAGADMSGVIPPSLEHIPDGYQGPADQQGTLERLIYTTYESFSYEERSWELTKTAWVYLPYGYTDEQRYNVLYLSHGGWSDETTIMGTDADPHEFKHVVDHGIEDGLIQPLIIVLPTYNNTSSEDSGDYSLALRLTDNFHNELVNDLIPAVESTYRTYAESVSAEGIEASRDHRGFAGFSMGSVNTWRTFEHSLPYFRYFMPMSGAISSDDESLASIVRDSRYASEDFFIYAMTGTDDFAYTAFKNQIDAMAEQGGTFVLGDSEAEGNLAYREREGYSHDMAAANEYTYNGLRFFWNESE